MQRVEVWHWLFTDVETALYEIGQNEDESAYARTVSPHWLWILHNDLPKRRFIEHIRPRAVRCE